MAVHDAGRDVVEERIGNRSYWWAAGPSGAPSARPRGRAFLLPAFDEFLVAYADRNAVLEAPHASYVNNGGGILNPTIVVDARVVGTWKRVIAGKRVTFAPAPFAPLDRTAARAVQDALARYARFLGLDARPR